MKDSFRTGFNFGLTSGVITTLGLIVGLYSGTRSLVAVAGGIVTIAVADAFSDALGIHVSTESRGVHTPREIWEATFATFFSKAVFALSFLVPIFIFDLGTAVIASVVWGMLLLGISSYKVAKDQGERPFGVIMEHSVIGIAVVGVTHLVGQWIAVFFGMR